MTTIQEQLEKFNALEYEVKKQKVLAMLEAVQDAHPYFKVLYENILTLNHPSDETLSTIYETLFALGNSLEWMKSEEIIAAAQKLQHRIEEIRAAEALDKQKEGSPEDLLNSL